MSEPHTPFVLPSQGKLLALDVGLARIGVAVCDPLRLASRPLALLVRRSRRDDFAQLAQIVQTQEAVAVVCGLPLNMDGSESDQARTTRKWAERLAHALRTLLGRPVPVILWDERLSTFAAQQIIADRTWAAAGNERAGSEMAEDAVAAAVILQDFLDAARRDAPIQDVILLPARPASA